MRPRQPSGSVRGAAACALAAAAMLMLAGPQAPAAELPDDLQLQRFRSRHYDVVTNVQAKRAREIARHMDQVYREYMNRIGRAGFRRRIKARMTLFLLETQTDYVRMLAAHGINGAGSGGMFFARGDDAALATFVDRRDPRQMLATLQHEGFHQFAYMMIGDLPIWVNEGLAEYFGDAALIDGKLELGQIGSDRVRLLKKGLDKPGVLQPFDKLLNMSHAEWRARLQGDPMARLLYDQSWSIVHFLVHGDDGRYRQRFMGYLRLIHRGVDSDAAFKKAFGTQDYQAFEERWRAHVEAMNPDPFAVAATRLRVLAEGLARLASIGRSPTSLDQLRRELRRIRFKATVGSHGSERTYTADDEELFQPPPGPGPGVATELTLQADQADGLPPTIVVTGLSRPVRITWSKDDDGDLSYEVGYGRD